jgi:nitrite reductase (NO-forming)
VHRRRVAFITAGLASCAALGIAGSAVLAGSASGATTKTVTTKITVTASEFKFKLSKTSAPVGTVIFTVKNVGKIGHNFKINGKVTKLLAPGKSAKLTVKFTKKGKFQYLCTVPGHAKLGMKGFFGVAVKPPVATTPTTTAAPVVYPGPGGTVTVSMFEYGFTLDPPVVPSGNVTFVMNNTGTATHNFDISGVAGGDGPFVNPGASASMTVNLGAGKTYQFLCDVPGHADLGMRGTFVPTP